MRNYIYERLRGQRPRIIDAIRQQVDAAYIENRVSTLNAYRGSVTGNGTVECSFVLGDIQAAENSLVSCCRVDRNVTLIVEEGAKVIGCSFHPYYGQSDEKAYPVIVRICKNALVAGVWTGEDVVIGENSIVYWSQIHCTRQDYGGARKSDGVTIGKNCVVYHTYLKSEDPETDTAMKCSVTVGDNAFVWDGRLTAECGELNIGTDVVVCSYANACRILFKGLLPKMWNQDFSRIPYSFQNTDESSGISCKCNKITIGAHCYIMPGVVVMRAYDKLKNPNVVIGDNVYICDTDNRERGETTPHLSVYNMEVGDNATLTFTGDGWYRGHIPYRKLYIGANTTLRLCPHRGDSTYLGTETRIPSNAVAII